MMNQNGSNGPTVEQVLMNIQQGINNVIYQNNGTKDEFIANPKEAIKKYLGIDIPENIDVKSINQENNHTVHFFLPYTPNYQSACENTACCKEEAPKTEESSSNEVNDNDLDNVAGGTNAHHMMYWGRKNELSGNPNQGGIFDAPDRRLPWDKPFHPRDIIG